MGLYGQDISYTLLFVGKPWFVLRYMFWDTPRRSKFWVIFQPPPEVGPILWQVPVQVQISLLSRHHFGQRLIKWFQGCKWRWLQQVLYYEQYWAREMWSCLMLMCHFVVSLWIDMDRWCIRYLCCISVFTMLGFAWQMLGDAVLVFQRWCLVEKCVDSVCDYIYYTYHVKHISYTIADDMWFKVIQIYHIDLHIKYIHTHILHIQYTWHYLCSNYTWKFRWSIQCMLVSIIWPNCARMQRLGLVALHFSARTKGAWQNLAYHGDEDIRGDT
jgi:hypothetical protein